MNKFTQLLVQMLMTGKVPNEFLVWQESVGTQAMRVAGTKYLSAAKGGKESIKPTSESYKAITWTYENPFCESEIFIFKDGVLYVNPAYVDQKALSDYVRKSYNPPIRR